MEEKKKEKGNQGGEAKASSDHCTFEGNEM
jgi:hypothetical protein